MTESRVTINALNPEPLTLNPTMIVYVEVLFTESWLLSTCCAFMKQVLNQNNNNNACHYRQYKAYFRPAWH